MPIACSSAPPAWAAIAWFHEQLEARAHVEALAGDGTAAQSIVRAIGLTTSPAVRAYLMQVQRVVQQGLA